MTAVHTQGVDRSGSPRAYRKAKNPPIVTPATTSMETSAANAARPDDDVDDRVERHRALDETFLTLCLAEDNLSATAVKRLGRCPMGLIAWRGYSAIGGDEIANARREFLEGGFPSDQVEAEYLDAKLREKAAKAERRRWKKAAGTDSICRQIKAVVRERREILKSLAAHPPRSVKGNSDLIARLLEYYDGCEIDDLGRKCLAAIARALVDHSEAGRV